MTYYQPIRVLKNNACFKKHTDIDWNDVTKNVVLTKIVIQASGVFKKEL